MLLSCPTTCHGNFGGSIELKTVFMQAVGMIGKKVNYHMKAKANNFIINFI